MSEKHTEKAESDFLGFKAVAVFESDLYGLGVWRIGDTCIIRPQVNVMIMIDVDRRNLIVENVSLAVIPKCSIDYLYKHLAMEYRLMDRSDTIPFIPFATAYKIARLRVACRLVVNSLSREVGK